MNAFDTSIKRALEKGWKEGARRMRAEKRMASALIKACISRGFYVSVDNGEAVEIDKSRSYKAVMDVMWQTDEEHVLIYDAEGKCLGWFFLVYGNDGWDLISDYNANETCDAIWNEVLQPLSDRIQEGL